MNGTAAVLRWGLLCGLICVAPARGGTGIASVKQTRPLERLAPVCPEELDADAVDTLEAAAAACENQRRYTQAIALLVPAIRLREAADGPDSPGLVVPLGALGRLCQSLGRLDQAEQAYESALRAVAAAPGSDVSSIAILTHLAQLYELKGKDAGPLYERALAYALRIHGPESAGVERILNNYAVFEKRRGRLPAARKLCERALAIQRKLARPEDPETATVLNNLGQVEALSGDRKRAQSFYRSAIDIWERSLAPLAPPAARPRRRASGLLLTPLSEAPRHQSRALRSTSLRRALPIGT